MRLPLLVFAVLLALVPARPGWAAEPVFPPGSRIGLVLLEGMKPARGVFGFEDADGKVRVAVAELPSAAFTELETALGQPGKVTAKPERVTTAIGPGFFSREPKAPADGKARRRFALIAKAAEYTVYAIAEVADDAAATYSDDAIRTMLLSVVTRPTIPNSEQLALLPFEVTELAGFKTLRTLAPGAALVLSDNDDATALEDATYVLISIVPGAPPPPADRARYAEQLMATVPGLRDARTVMSEPIRITGVPGYEMRVEAVSGKDNKPVTVVQWLRFGGGASLRIVAGASREAWPEAFPRFRAVRDGIQGR